LLNNGNGTFAAAVNYSAGSGSWSVFAADLDSDGDNDMAVANYNSGSVSILISTVNNPVPTTTSISPDSKTVGDPGFIMAVNGTNFVAGSIVRLDGSDRATTFVGSTELTAVLLSSDMASAGTFNITVFNPAPGGGTSTAQIFTVNNRNGGGLPAEAYNPSIPPPGGFGVLINNAAPETDSRNVVLTLKGGPNTARMALSNDPDLDGMGSTGQIPYQSSYDWDICKGQAECAERVYTVYVKFYTRWGRWSELVSDGISYKKQKQEEVISPTEITKIFPASFTRDLKIGMTGEDVKELQTYLNNHGFILASEGPGSPGKETNYFGTLTQTALINFQKANNISPAVGYFGPVTRGVVNKE
ncbi:peptidoglycan-binding protein, partial [Patescibacteria group bacterium]|nr:peptidoglycan-binding protein [Patescibacteria group bacterium]